MKYETAGDPMTVLKWTKRTTRKISAELATLNIHVSHTTVGNLLHRMGYLSMAISFDPLSAINIDPPTSKVLASRFLF